jgi:hypothetical protein
MPRFPDNLELAMACRRADPVFLDAFPWFNTQRYWEEHLLSLKEQMAALHEAPLQWQAS